MSPAPGPAAREAAERPAADMGLQRRERPIPDRPLRNLRGLVALVHLP